MVYLTQRKEKEGRKRKGKPRAIEGRKAVGPDEIILNTGIARLPRFSKVENPRFALGFLVGLSRGRKR